MDHILGIDTVEKQNILLGPDVHLSHISAHSTWEVSEKIAKIPNIPALGETCSRVRCEDKPIKLTSFTEKLKTD